MRLLTKLCVAIVLGTLSFSITVAENTAAKNNEGFNMDEATKMMEAEYQQQLRRKQKPRKQKVKRKKNKNTLALKKVAVAPRHRPAPVVRPRYVAPAVHQPARATAARVAVPVADELFRAASNGNVALIGRLLRQGVNINAANRERETALHMAAAGGHYSAVIYLINHGANVNALTVKNWIPLHHAVRFRHAEIANYLLKRGSYAQARTSDGLRAVDMAKATNNQYMVNLLGGR